MNKFQKIFAAVIVVFVCVFAFSGCGNKTKNELQTYTFVFESNGGTAKETIVINKGEKLDLSVVPTKDGYYFDGWYFDLSDTENTSDCFYNDGVYYEESSAGSGSPVVYSYYYDTKGKNPCTLYAKWSEYIIIDFDTDGGDAIPDIKAKSDEWVDIINTPARDGFIFSGYYYDAEFQGEIYPTGAENTIKIQATEDKTVYLKWLPAVTVTFDTRGGSEIDPIIYAVNQYVASFPNPTKDGLVFMGWFNDINLTEEYRPNVMTEDLTLYAKYGVGTVVSLSRSNFSTYFDFSVSAPEIKSVTYSNNTTYTTASFSCSVRPKQIYFSLSEDVSEEIELTFYFALYSSAFTSSSPLYSSTFSITLYKEDNFSGSKGYSVNLTQYYTAYRSYDYSLSTVSGDIIGTAVAENTPE
jgi:uncharacterized repeat protein (TIGR02543 family)